MTADFFPFDMNFLGRAAPGIVNEVKGSNRMVYDVTSKPPRTIEWSRLSLWQLTERQLETSDILKRHTV